MQETWVRSLGWADPLEEGMVTHSSILAWRFPWTKEPGGYSPCSRKELDMTELLSTWKTIYWYLDVAFSPIRNDTAALDCILNSYCNLHVPSCNQVLCLKNSFVVVQLLSHVQFYETPWIVAHQAFPSITISQFAQTHVCWVSDAIQPSYPLSPLLLPSIFPRISIFTMNWLFSSSALSNKEIPWIFPVFWITPVLQLHLIPLVSLISFAGSPIPSFHLASLSQLFLFPSLLLGAF